MLPQTSCPGRYRSLSSKNAVASTSGLQARVARCTPAPVVLKVEAALSRAQKEEVVGKITEKLDKSILVYGLRFKGISVGQIEKMRRDLPKGAEMYITKNRLLRVAVDNLGEKGTRWEGLKGQKGDNAWVFADEDSIRGSVEAYNKFAKELKDMQVIPKNGPAPPAPTEITAIVIDGKVMPPAQLSALEKLPTKAEIITMIARGIKATPTKLAFGLKAVPRKLAYGIKALSELNDDKSMTVEQAAKLKAANPPSE